MSCYFLQKTPPSLASFYLALKGDAFCAYFSQPSSYSEYLGQRETEWVHPEEILSYFSNSHSNNSYQNFIEESDDFPIIDYNEVK